MKICGTCEVEKSEADFQLKSKAGALPIKYHSQCKACQSSYQKKWYARNKVTTLLRAKKNNLVYKARNRQAIITYFQDKSCVDCGVTDYRVFQFDHKDDVVKVKDVSLLIAQSYSLKTVFSEIDKCYIRCANCHQIRTGIQSNCWWTRQ